MRLDVIILLQPVRHQNLRPPHFPLLALCALGPDVVTFVDAKDVNKKTYRAKPGSLSEKTTEDTWRAITDAL